MLTAILAGMAASKGLLVVDMLAIGRLENGKWSNLASKPSDPVSKLRNIPFVELGLSGTKGRLTIPRLDLQSDVAEGWFAINEKWSNKVLWSGTAPKLPKVQVYSPSAKVYLDVVRAHLKSKGLTGAKARINSVVGVDLDGDGVREVVIEAAPLTDMVPRTMGSGSRVDYTSILIRWVRNGKPATVVLDHHDSRKEGYLEGADQLRAIADFDFDGRFELVCSSDYYEGQSAAVYSFRKGAVKKLVEYGAGV
jgi:hypothetical protein